MVKDLHRYNHVLALASKHDSGGKFKMACSVYKGKKLLYVGYNQYPASRGGESINKLYAGLGVHAELAVLRQLLSTNTETRKLSLYVAGVNSNGVALLSKPCPRCHNLILDKAFKSITYFNGTLLVTEHVTTLEPLEIPIYNERKVKEIYA